MDFASFRTFTDESAATELTEWLRGRGLHARIGDSPAYFDPTFANSILTRSWTVLLPPAEFQDADRLMTGFFELGLQRLPADYYLYSFSDDELRAIYREPDAWGDLDKVLARKLLAERGVAFSDDDARELEERRRQELARPEDSVTSGAAYWGYGLCLAALAASYTGYGFGLGVLAAMLGSLMARGSKTLPDGSVLPRYDVAARKHGKRIILLAIGVIIICFALRLIAAFGDNGSEQ